VVLGLIYIVFTNFTADKILLRTYALICLVGIIDTTVSAVIAYSIVTSAIQMHLNYINPLFLCGISNS